MTKKLSVLILLAVFFVLGFSQTALASLGDTLLRVGSTGSDVVQLQTELNYLGYNVGTADGIFGTKNKNRCNCFSNSGIFECRWNRWTNHCQRLKYCIWNTSSPKSVRTE